MSDTKISNLTAGSTLASGDLLPFVDVSDETMATSGTNKRITYANLAVEVFAETATLTNKTIDGDANTLQDIAYSSIKSTSRSGSDATLITGTKGTSADLSVWNADGDLVDGPTPPTGTIVGTSDTQTLINKTLTAPVIESIVDSNADNVISGGGTTTIGDATQSEHTIIKAGPSKLVKIKILRQDNTSDSYEENTVLLSGYGVMVPNAVVTAAQEAVTFGITFDQAPIVVISEASRNNDASPTWGSNENGNVRISASVRSPTTANFNARLISSDGTAFGDNSDTYFYSWLAVGELA